MNAPVENVAKSETYTLSNKNHQEKNNKHEKMNELPKTGQSESKSPLLISALFTALGALLLRRLK
ncbi:MULTISPECIES: LPXTG cell wall anchor domain-containing protein [Staphylococcus]|uniref:Gram-positive cocci surface proteins LPxTG domain-containing protein n=1 Tax=Staphylococcus schleiferi TaxID=1295 RepID=A0A7Z7QP48_STASC|nr:MULTISPECIES: LPXTG cell wall anchor domain-containing protein [Staphylococcus]QGS45913.1 LPXTG cell wall anchor domain-containing protein [Mammaliicoccus fleurettii]MBF1992962.1 LPXTG cell wall anchor domain-containing protein [Staphylococcus schleiferi]MBF2038434.1 LPXTG cell wall anchor domain-containing protein [Staphylococcus schleiferi]MBF2100355.1 LPXTG cell wall anchor domain-containing protein [Staphylococcus schleiferi]MBF2102660.1 LPXTG cell wall anchor domain-containing protein 